MRSPFLSLLIFMGLFMGYFSVSAQRAPTQRAAASEPTKPTGSVLALASVADAAPVTAPRLACTKLDGVVLGADGQPLIGATITVKGTQQLYITDGDGKYLIESPVYQGQVLAFEAAGYVTRELKLTDSTVPSVGLELAPGTRIRKNGKHAGQVVRFGTADLQ